jgi:hypothetical protein
VFLGPLAVAGLYEHSNRRVQEVVMIQERLVFPDLMTMTVDEVPLLDLLAVMMQNVSEILGLVMIKRETLCQLQDLPYRDLTMEIAQFPSYSALTYSAWQPF